MGIVVQKFGGSSVADTDKIERVAELAVATKRAGHDVVVVVSAMGGTTDQLVALAKRITETPPRRELDMLVSTGERVTMALLSMAIQKRGCDAISFTGSQSGIITNDRHFDARIIEVRPHRVEDELSRGRIVIIAGYQGMSYRREITTLGRGGSDTTALAMAAALGAERAEIYSDVDGVYSADPRVVPGAAHLPEVDYDTMQALSDAGAKVLHSGAVEFAAKANIAIHARSTFAPGRETVVRRVAEPTACAVTGMRGVVRVRTTGDAVHRGAMAAAEQGHIHVMRHGPREEGHEFLLDTRHAPDWMGVRAVLEKSVQEAGSLEGGFAEVTVVGAVDGQDERARTCLTAAGIAVHDFTVAPLRISALVSEGQVDDAVRLLHLEFLRL